MWNIRFMLIFLYIIIAGGSLNPCVDGNHSILPKGGWRGTACKRTREESICDRYVETGTNKWYKVVGHDDRLPRKMAEGPVRMFYCGTNYPLYLPKGAHPKTDGLVVTKIACMHAGSDVCKKQYPVQILKCGTFFLYNLSRPDSCDVAYCFGEDFECSKPDPCEEKNRLNLPISEDRSTSCQDKSLRLCDSLLKNSWYRPLKGNVDIKMTSSCVERFSCGTEAPIWLNGVEPTLADKTVHMKACVNLGKTSTCTCDREIDIQVRNCSSYLVYNLTATLNCPERYCFGNAGKCHEDSKETASFWKNTSNVVLVLFAVVLLIVFSVTLAVLIFKKFFNHSTKIRTTKDEIKSEVQHSQSGLKRKH